MSRHIPVQAICDDTVARAGVDLVVARLDLVHPLAPGNKLFKLIPNLERARSLGFSRVASFGGIYSNHIHALAALGAEQGMETVGYIRNTCDGHLTPTLEDARRWGMKFHFLSRGEYRRRHDPEFRSALPGDEREVYWVPEGGSNLCGVRGCAAIVDTLRAAGIGMVDEVVLPVGTGGTLAGLASALSPGRRALGVAVLKGQSFLERDVARFVSELGGSGEGCWALDHRFHGGGYARSGAELRSFIERFQARHGIPLEPVYSGKMFYGLYQRLAAGEYRQGTRIVALHTGGLQGARGQLSADSPGVA